MDAGIGIVVASISLYGLVLAFSKSAKPAAGEYSFGEFLWFIHGPSIILAGLILYLLPFYVRYGIFMLLVLVNIGFALVGITGLVWCSWGFLKSRSARSSTWAGFGSVVLTSMYLFYLTFKDGPVVI